MEYSNYRFHNCFLGIRQGNMIPLQPLLLTQILTACFSVNFRHCNILIPRIRTAKTRVDP